MVNRKAAALGHEIALHHVDDYELGELAGVDFSSEATEAQGRAQDFENNLNMTGFYLQHDFNYFDL